MIQAIVLPRQVRHFWTVVHNKANMVVYTRFMLY